MSRQELSGFTMFTVSLFFNTSFSLLFVFLSVGCLESSDVSGMCV